LVVKAGQSIDFQTRWLALDPIGTSRRIFVHVVDPATGKIVAQHDGLDALAILARGRLDWPAACLVDRKRYSGGRV
jgi:hypothetical protein